MTARGDMDKVIALPVVPRRRLVASNGVVGMVVFVLAEAMFFAGLISAFSIVKTTAFTEWPPPGQPRLPIERTALNTLALIASGVTLWMAERRFERPGRALALRPLLWTIGLGTFFVVFQGLEWVALVTEGLTVTSSTHGSFFYLIVGAHGLHALAALGGLGASAWRLRAGDLSRGAFSTVQVFWYFVVTLWPFLYWRVYL